MKRKEIQLFDVVICGGGLAGLSLALQLKLNFEHLHICIIERQQRPIQAAAHKVGESSVEGGAYYLMKHLNLQSYVENEHIEKLGLRFFGNRHQNFAERFERGISEFEPGLPSYQFDRGLLETHLREMVDQKDICFEEGARVDDIVIDPNGLNQVHFLNVASNQKQICAPWVIDATGRRQLLQRKLKLQKPSPHKASASWWRVKGECDISSLVPSKDTSWHSRTKVRRWQSTNHLMGKGYWVWLIPLASGHTSIGIVSDNDLHPISERSNYENGMKWLTKHEPETAELLTQYQHIDYRIIKSFAHLSHQVFSENGWTCVGEAGVFSDPLYSIGLDLIAMENTCTTALIELQMSKNLNTTICNIYNDVFLNVVEMVTELYQGMYSMFGNDDVFLPKLTWDYMIYWGYIAPLIVHNIFRSPEAVSSYEEIGVSIRKINQDCQLLFYKWAENSPPNCLPRGLYTKSSAPFQENLRLSLLEEKTTDEFLKEANMNLIKMETHVGVLFKHASKEIVFDDQLKKLFERYSNRPSCQEENERYHDEYLNEYFVPVSY